MNFIAKQIRRIAHNSTTPARVAGIVEDAVELVWAAAKAVFIAVAVLAGITLPYIMDWILSYFNL